MTRLPLSEGQTLAALAADWAPGVRLTKINEEEKSSIINRPARSTYPKMNSDNHLAGLRAARESGGVKVKVRTHFDPTEAV